MSIESRINTAVDAIIARRDDPEQMSIVIENLSRDLGFAVSMAARGDPRTIDELLVGALKDPEVDEEALASLQSKEGEE